MSSRRVWAAMAVMVFGAVSGLAGAEQAGADVARAYGFAPDSSYETLVGAMRRASDDLARGENSEQARRALELAASYVPPERHLELQYDFGLTSEWLDVKISAAKALSEGLQSGVRVPEPLGARIADRLCRDLGAVTDRSDQAVLFVRYATETLLWMGDPRALDIVLSDTVVVNNLRIVDGWKNDDAPDVFEGLAARYAAEDDTPGNASRAALYRLMAERRRAERPIVATKPVIDMEAFKNLSPPPR